MNRWYTSDLHFGHSKLSIKGYRLFDSVPDMHEALIAGWNDVVGDEDEVWVLGDFAVPATEENIALGARLSGRKILVPGNHDRCFIDHESRPWKRIGCQVPYTRLAEFVEIIDNPAPHRIAGEDVAISHFPYTADHKDYTRYPEYRPKDVGGWLAHGHLHEMWLQQGKQINVGVDAWAFSPVHYDQMAELIRQGPANRMPLPSPYLGAPAIANAERQAAAA